MSTDADFYPAFDCANPDLTILANDVKRLYLEEHPWCQEYLYSAIRHLSKNCQIDCLNDSKHICNSYSQYDGPALARLISSIPALLREMTALRESAAASEIRVDEEHPKT